MFQIILILKINNLDTKKKSYNKTKMNTSSRISKRRFSQVYSPSSTDIFASPCKSMALNTKKKLSFSPQESPLTYKQSTFQIIDEDSCDSGFADMSNDFFCKVVREEPTSPAEPLVQISFSDSISDSDINCEEERLIGDLTRKHTLPIMSKSKHNDLASITPSTLADLIDGKYTQIGKYLILDARYPYEFVGGHINSAESAYSKDLIFDKLFKQKLVDNNGEPLVLIFHCEFSSERGPRLMREIREKDRAINKHSYPNLHYPEMYLLEGGYKSFFESFDSLCEPKQYVQMLDNKHRDDLKFFRKKSKSLDLENKKRSTKVKLSF